MKEAMIENDQNWSQYSFRKRACYLDKDMVYATIKPQQRRGNGKRYAKPSNRGTLYIGKDICKLLQLSSRDRVTIYFNTKDPYFMKVIKSNSGLLLSESKNSGTVYVHFRSFPDDLSILIPETTRIDFDILNDRSLILDFSKFKDKQ
jgi:hypothetical protein